MTDEHERPEGLGPAGAALWDDLTDGLEFREDELRLLTEAARTLDLIERMESELRGGALTVPGSRGQTAVNPLVSEIRHHRTVLRQLLAALDIPEDETAGGAGSRSASARALANARWGRG